MVKTKLIGWAAFFLILALIISANEIIEIGGTIIGIGGVVAVLIGIWFFMKRAKLKGLLMIVLGALVVVTIFIAGDILAPILEFLKLISDIPFVVPALILLSAILAIKGGNFFVKILGLLVFVFGATALLTEAGELITLPSSIISLLTMILEYKWWWAILFVSLIVFIYNSSQTARTYLKGSSEYLKQKYKEPIEMAKAKAQTLAQIESQISSLLYRERQLRKNIRIAEDNLNRAVSTGNQIQAAALEQQRAALISERSSVQQKLRDLAKQKSSLK